MLDLQPLASFVAVVNAGSFVGAADALGLSKAAVSRHVTELEARLGSVLAGEGQRLGMRAYPQPAPFLDRHQRRGVALQSG